jgi:hypothetical protein
MLACLSSSPVEAHFTWLIYPCKEGALGLGLILQLARCCACDSRFIVPSLSPSL